MTLAILDASTLAAVNAAATQQAQRAALIASWAGGNITARLMSGATLLETLTHGPWVLNSATPRGMTPGALIARTFVASGTPDKVVFRNGSTDIFSITIGAGGVTVHVNVQGSLIGTGSQADLAESLARLVQPELQRIANRMR